MGREPQTRGNEGIERLAGSHDETVLRDATKIRFAQTVGRPVRRFGGGERSSLLVNAFSSQLSHLQGPDELAVSAAPLGSHIVLVMSAFLDPKMQL
jgi:hypothetical protein